MVYDLSVFIWGNAKFSQRVKVITGYAFGVCIYLSEWNYFLQLLPITHTWELVCQEIIDLSPGMSLSWVLSETRTKLPQWVEQHLMDGDNRFDCLRLKKKKTTLGGSKFPINGGIQVKSGWPLGGDKVEEILEPCFPESGPRTRCISITWKLVTKAESQAPPKTY